MPVSGSMAYGTDMPLALYSLVCTLGLSRSAWVAHQRQVYGHVAAGLQQEAANAFVELVSAEM